MLYDYLNLIGATENRFEEIPKVEPTTKVKTDNFAQLTEKQLKNLFSRIQRKCASEKDKELFVQFFIF